MTTESSVVLRMPKTKADEKEDWLKKPLMDKFKDHYHHGRTDHIPNFKKFISKGGTIWLIYCATTELYVFLQYITPWYYQHYSTTFRLCFYLFSVFVYFQMIVNRYLFTSTDSSISSMSTEQNGTNSEGKISNETANSPLRWCEVCNAHVPPRAHHCVVCQKCILKRDHHCYITGVCAGFTNQRFFLVLNFYILVASFGFIHIVSYVRHHMPPDFTWINFILPVAITRWLLGSIQTHMMFMICLLNTQWWMGLMAMGFVSLQFRVLQLGLTTHEYMKVYPKIRCTDSVSSNFRSVFGDYWMINFLFPAHKLFPQEGDGRQWKNLIRPLPWG